MYDFSCFVDSIEWKILKDGYFLKFSVSQKCHFLNFLLNLVTMETETGSGQQTVFFLVMGQENTTHKVWAKSETMRAGPLCRYFGAYMELLLISEIHRFFVVVFFCGKNVRSFSTKIICVFGYKVVKHSMSWPPNELVKLTMLWTTGPKCIRFDSLLNPHFHTTKPSNPVRLVVQRNWA